jgi:hypothetical protein
MIVAGACPLTHERPHARPGALRPAARGAALGLAALALAACATSAPQTAAPACPPALFLQGAEHTASYRPGAARQPDALRHLAVMTNLASGCRYVAEGVDVDLAFDLIAERGPAFAGSAADLAFFVATIAPDGQILSKQVLSSAIPFGTGEDAAGVSEQLTVRVPAVTAEQGGAYRLYLGFQLDEAELASRREPLLR